jgi:hypothetical protein
LSNTIGWALDFFDNMILAEHQDIERREETLQKVKEYMLENKIEFDAIFAYDEHSLLVASYLAGCFNLPSIPFDFALKMTNACLFRKVCLQADIDTPNFCIIKSSDRLAVLKEVIDLQIRKFKSEIKGQEMEWTSR